MVEVGLGGRLDATNVLEPEALAACGIAALGLDHEAFLLRPEEGTPEEPMARIAFEKAGIAKRGVPLVTMGNEYPDEARDAIRAVATRSGAILIERENGPIDDMVEIDVDAEGFDFDSERGHEEYRNVSLLGDHQYRNAWLAKAMIEAQSAVPVAHQAFARGVRRTSWPARLQLLKPGPLTFMAEGHQIWLDGGHNPSAGQVIAQYFREPLHLVIGMLANKDPLALLEPLAGHIENLIVVPVPGHDCHPPVAFGPDATGADDLEEALLQLPDDDCAILIAGSLYLAGEALRLNDEVPD